MSGLFSLFKGDSGSGKTVGALSFPKPIVLDHDRKMPAIGQKHFPGKKIDFVQYSDVLHLGDQIEKWLTGECPYETIIGDSITSLSYACLKTMDDVKGTSILKKFRDFAGTRDSKKQIELRGFDYYNAEDSFLKYYIDGLKMLWSRPGNPKHVILIAHVMTSEQQNMMKDTVVETRRIVTAGNKIAAYIPAQFDDAWHFGVSHGDLFSKDSSAPRVKHFCVTEALGNDFAKTAYNLPAKIDFTNGSLYDLVKDQLEVETEQPTTEQQTRSKLLSL